ncbi:GntP family permease [Youngiibacter fragilis]|uniref:Membrane protein n=1 Tax=Youngiibacter fragilis 232.1 TaxID=994573 RepID=V7I9Z0_9CLOT|nr:GntP family permease [Youngiibacter fragilis]ETA82154.1 membrane protein [Youngiibacter fragilis 232.1]
MEYLSLAGILLGLAVLIFISFKGVPIIITAPLAAMVVILFSQMPIVGSFTGPFMTGFTNFAKNYFLIFLLSAVYGKMMADSGAAKSIAYKLSALASKFPGNEKFVAIFSLVIVNSVFTYGGISLFVVMFTMVIIAKNLFEELGIPWRLYTLVSLGMSVYTMTMLPGTPAIQNIIPIKYLGTTPTAAPILGLIGTAVSLVLGIAWIKFQLARAEKLQEGFLPTGTEISKVVLKEEKFEEMNLLLALTPSIVLLIVLNLLKQPAVVALFAAVMTCVVLFYKKYVNMIKTMSEGANNATMAIVNICIVVAFGSVVSASAGYALVIGALDSIPGPPIVQIIVAVNIAAGVTGSASGGLGIALESLSQKFLATGINPEVIHRVAAMSCGGLDSLPHNAAIINDLGVSRLTHKQAYINMFMLTVVTPTIATIVVAIFAMMGVV